MTSARAGAFFFAKHHAAVGVGGFGYHPQPLLMLYARRLALAAALAFPVVARAQSVDLTIRHTGLSIGDSRFVRGIRLNFRDSRLEEVVGINATIWSPYEPSHGVVRGVALGLPLT